MGMLSCAEIVWFSMQALPMQRFSARGNGPILTPAIEQSLFFTSDPQLCNPTRFKPTNGLLAI